jgi:dTMP kinase
MYITANVKDIFKPFSTALSDTDKIASGLPKSSQIHDPTTITKKTSAIFINMRYNGVVMKYYCVEGTDGSGKKTQIKKLADYLRGKGETVAVVSFPDYGSLSSAPVKMYLSGEFGDDPNALNPYCASTLFATDRICKIKKMEKEFADNTTVIFDRYVQSNMTHQAGKIKNQTERENFMRWVDEFEFNMLGLPRPDKVIFMDMPVDKTLELLKNREQLKIGDEFDRDIHENNYTHLTHAYNAGKEAARIFGWIEIQCTDEFEELKTADEIHEAIKTALGV